MKDLTKAILLEASYQESEFLWNRYNFLCEVWVRLKMWEIGLMPW